jgi:hypothetical protein
MEGMSLGGELVLVSACLTVTPLITDGPETHTHTCAWDKDHDIFDPGSRSDGSSLPRNRYGDKDMFLELSKDKL